METRADTDPNCPEHGERMIWNEKTEAYYCPEPCGWEFHI